jgi:hypothetical protein
MRSASVDFPWSMWAMIEKFRILLAGAATGEDYGGVLPLLFAAAALWTPVPTTEPWQLQLQGKVDTSVKASVFDVDGQETSASKVSEIHAGGAKAVCYFSAGTYENWRPDRKQFPKRVIGRKLPEWEGEYWLDARKLDVLVPIMRGRMEACAAKGFDGIDIDNVDAYTHPTGFPLKGADQLEYNRALASEAHDLGLAIGLKNDLPQIPKLVDDFDFAINEQCFQYHECGRVRPFIEAGKPVFNVEYGAFRCDRSRELGFSSIRKRFNLRRWRRTC